MVDAVLWPHHSGVRDQVAAPAAKRRIAPERRKRVRSGPFRTTKTSSAALPPRVSATRRYDSFVAITTSARRKASRSTSERRAVQQVATLSEAREVELRDEVVVVEDEACAATSQRQRSEQHHVGRVARVDDVELPLAGQSPHEAKRSPERLRVLADIAEDTSTCRREREPVDLDSFDYARTVVSRSWPCGHTTTTSYPAAEARWPPATRVGRAGPSRFSTRIRTQRPSVGTINLGELACAIGYS